MTYYTTRSGLFCYQTGDFLRTATPGERAASQEASRHDGGAGVIGEGDLEIPIPKETLAELHRQVYGNEI